MARFEDKTMRLQRRAAIVGGDQAIYEEFFGALGYKANRDAFRALARAVPLSDLRAAGGEEEREALLFGAAGLLPDPSRTRVLPQWQDRVRRLWDLWWRLDRPATGICWRRGGMRPTNTPERRLAAGILFLERCALAPEDFLLGRARVAHQGRELLRTLGDALDTRSPWEGAVHFGAALRRSARLLGKARVLDISVNVFLPALRARGERDGCDALSDLARDAYLLAPRMQTNRLLTEASHRFFVPPSRARTMLGRAALQQGLIEIYRSFCLALDGDCASCPFVCPSPAE